VTQHDRALNLALLVIMVSVMLLLIAFILSRGAVG
jgi:hypothetical protein